ncbi:helix-turn-helix transcriptional regulator [bacterium]|nr:helix-turn-helix transcriptional regulator [bacterium]
MHNPAWGSYVRMGRKKQGMTLRQVAAIAGIDASYITLIERDGYIPKRDKVIALAKSLDLDVDRALLEAGYAPEGIAISTILSKNTLETTEDILIPELSKCLRELISLSSVQQRKVADFLNSFVYTLRYKEREKRNILRGSRQRSRRMLS